MKERKKEIETITQNLLLNQFLKSRKQIEAYCEEQSTDMVKDFLDTFSHAILEAGVVQAEGKKDNICYILFSYLYSSIFLQKYIVRIDVLDYRFYNDVSQVESNWDAHALYHYFESDVNEILNEIRKNIPRIREYEIDYLRYAYLPYYQSVVKKWIQIMAEELINNGSFLLNEISRKEEIKILFGEYMGSADIIGIWNR